MSHFSGPYFGGSEVVELGEASSGANRERAINAIRAICEEGPFYRVSYDGSTASIGDAVQAASIEANEVRSQFSEATLNRRELVRDRVLWSFEAHIAFDGPNEVSVEEWERRVGRKPVILGYAQVGGDTRVSRAVRIVLNSVSYEHPPRQGSAAGTRVFAVFNVIVAPE